MKKFSAFLLVLIAAAPIGAAAPPPLLPKIPIEVQVEVNEVDNARADSLGIDWLDSFSIVERKAPGVASIGSVGRTPPLKADVHFLVEEGAAQLLANPNLVTDSGSAATFHAGGEIPYITSSSLGTTNVEFKSYGVTLNILPKLLANGRIQMAVKAGVSAPDESSGVALSGNSVPGLLSREVSSNVTIEQNATMTLAGLVQTQKTVVMRGVPFLRKLPLLGGLFRWRRTNFRRTTIIMFVTPRVIAPRE